MYLKAKNHYELHRYGDFPDSAFGYHAAVHKRTVLFNGTFIQSRICFSSWVRKSIIQKNRRAVVISHLFFPIKLKPLKVKTAAR